MYSESVFDVLPNLILLPNLPSTILSPANGKIGCILVSSTKVPPDSPFKSISVEPSLTRLTLPPDV